MYINKFVNKTHILHFTFTCPPQHKFHRPFQSHPHLHLHPTMHIIHLSWNVNNVPGEQMINRQRASNLLLRTDSVFISQPQHPFAMYQIRMATFHSHLHSAISFTPPPLPGRNFLSSPVTKWTNEKSLDGRGLPVRGISPIFPFTSVKLLISHSHPSPECLLIICAIENPSKLSLMAGKLEILNPWKSRQRHRKSSQNGVSTPAAPHNYRPIAAAAAQHLLRPTGVQFLAAQHQQWQQ